MSGRYEGASLVVVLPVSDLVRAESWYGRLGFAVEAEYPTYLILRAEHLELHLFARTDEADATSWSGAYLRVPDVDTVFAAWEAAGAHILLPPTDRDHGQREFAAEDPDGNLWRVGSPIGATHAGLGADARWVPPTDASEATAVGAPDGRPGTPDDAWYDIVVAGACAGCGHDAQAAATELLAGLLVDEARRWSPLLTAMDDDEVRRRPAPDTWSPLEYAAHVRDTLAVFTERTGRMLTEVDPDLGWWDHEAAIEHGWANESEVAAVADDLAENAQRLRDLLGAMPADGWTRTGRRAGTEPFTVELLIRFAVHEVVHHRGDAERAAAADDAADSESG